MTMDNHHLRGLESHRVHVQSPNDVLNGKVTYSPAKSCWFLVMAAGAFIGAPLTFTWPSFALFVVSTVTVLLFGHSLGSHRRLIHRSYECPRWLEMTFIWLGSQVGLAGPLGLLRQHEVRDYAQRLPDCHDYLKHGQPFLIDGWWQLNCRLELTNPPDLHLEKSIVNDRFIQWLERTWTAQHLAIAVALYAIGGWSFVFWGVCARVTAGVFGHWLIGWFAHNHGELNYRVTDAAVQGRNIPFVSLLTMGESWHNNHHAFPGSARLGLRQGEWDPGWWVLNGLSQVGLVWNLKLPKDLPFRPELSRARHVTVYESVGPRELANLG